VGDVLTCYENI